MISIPSVDTQNLIKRSIGLALPVCISLILILIYYTKIPTKDVIINSVKLGEKDFCMWGFLVFFNSAYLINILVLIQRNIATHSSSYSYLIGIGYGLAILFDTIFPLSLMRLYDYCIQTNHLSISNIIITLVGVYYFCRLSIFLFSDEDDDNVRITSFLILNSVYLYDKQICKYYEEIGVKKATLDKIYENSKL